jgi:hypothetical protein
MKTIMRDEENGIIIEFNQVGSCVKVSAIDTKTGTEVSILGPAGESRAVLKSTVIRKLHYVMRKKQQNGNNDDNFA